MNNINLSGEPTLATNAVTLREHLPCSSSIILFQCGECDDCGNACACRLSDNMKRCIKLHLRMGAELAMRPSLTGIE